MVPGNFEFRPTFRLWGGSQFSDQSRLGKILEFLELAKSFPENPRLKISDPAGAWLLQGSLGEIPVIYNNSFVTALRAIVIRTITPLIWLSCDNENDDFEDDDDDGE